MKRIYSSACILFRRENNEIKYLLLRYRFGHWGFTKGMIENNETEKETIKREIREETGIRRVKFIDSFKERMHYFLRRDGILYFKEVSFCIGETKEKKVNLSFEHTDYKWLNYEDAYKQLTYRNSKRVLRKANRFIS